jgi:hypothetical protein
VGNHYHLPGRRPCTKQLHDVMKKFLAIFLMLGALQTAAQAGKTTAIGTYYLEGVMEVGSGFQFNADHTFDFFFSYGALDRVAAGTWEQRGDSIILQHAKPPHDFKLVQAKKTGSGRITIKITDSNTLLLQNVFAEVKCGGSVYRDGSNEEGQVVFEGCKPSRISLIHPYFSERFSEFEVTQPDADYFEFTIEPWIADVAFDGLVFLLKGDTLTGPHPLLEPKEYTYTR